MDRDRAKELAPIIQAFGEGKTIQHRGPYSTKWVDAGDISSTLFFHDAEYYRIKTDDWDDQSPPTAT